MRFIRELGYHWLKTETVSVRRQVDSELLIRKLLWPSLTAVYRPFPHTVWFRPPTNRLSTSVNRRIKEPEVKIWFLWQIRHPGIYFCVS